MYTLMRHDLIDEYRIWVYPLVLGTGHRLFPTQAEHRILRLDNTLPLGSGVVVLTYLIRRPRSSSRRQHRHRNRRCRHRHCVHSFGVDSKQVHVTVLRHNKRPSKAGKVTDHAG